jgi:hypothetical protein
MIEDRKPSESKGNEINTDGFKLISPQEGGMIQILTKTTCSKTHRAFVSSLSYTHFSPSQNIGIHSLKPNYQQFPYKRSIAKISTPETCQHKSFPLSLSFFRTCHETIHDDKYRGNQRGRR